MKVAISVPDAIFEAAERLAKERRIPRSQLFAEALRDYVEHHGADSITAKLNEVYSQEQSEIEGPLADIQYASLNDEAW